MGGTSRGFLMSCLKAQDSSPSRSLLPPPRYPSMPKYPPGVVTSGGDRDSKGKEEEEVRTAVFSVVGMTCSACAGSVEKAIKRLPGIRDAAVAVLNNRAQALFYPAFVSEYTILETIEDAGFEAVLEEDRRNRNALTCRLRIKGMTCTSCSSSVESALQGLNGVHKATVALATEEAEIKYDPSLASVNQLKEAVEDTGFEARVLSTGEDKSKLVLKIDGIQIEDSKRMVEVLLEEIPGIEKIDIDQKLEKVSISYSPNLTGPRDFIEAIESKGPNGCKVSIFLDEEERVPRRDKEIKQYYRSFLWSLIFTIPIFLTAMVFMYIPGIKHLLETKIVNMLDIGQLLRWILSTPIQFIIGWRFYTGSYKALRRGSANMDVLIALGTNAAYFYSVYQFSGLHFLITLRQLISLRQVQCSYHLFYLENIWRYWPKGKHPRQLPSSWNWHQKLLFG